MSVCEARGAVSHCTVNINIAHRQTIARKNIALSCCPFVSDSRLINMLPSRKPPAPPGTATTPTNNRNTNQLFITFHPFQFAAASASRFSGAVLRWGRGGQLPPKLNLPRKSLLTAAVCSSKASKQLGYRLQETFFEGWSG